MQVRTIAPEELGAWVEATHVPFFATNPVAEEVDFRRQYVDFGRTWAAFAENAQIVGTLRSFESQLTVPGGNTIVADAVTNVGVSPVYRRRGVMSSLVKGALHAAAERTEPLSILIAAEYPIYGRFGYGPATQHAGYSVDAKRARQLQPAAGTVELVSAEAARQVAPGIHDVFRRQHAGALAKMAYWWDVELGLVEAFGRPRWKGFCAVHRNASGEPTGFLQYHVEEGWEGRVPRNTLKVDELLSTTPDAYAALWQFACDIDWITTVNADDRRVDEPLPWLLPDARAVRLTSRADFLWLRILDIAAALSSRGYIQTGRSVFEVVDPLGFAAGRFELQTGSTGAQVRPTSASAELTLDVGDLSAAYLGGTSLAALHEVGRIDEHAQGGVERLDSLLRTTRPPWCHTWF